MICVLFLSICYLSIKLTLQQEKNLTCREVRLSVGPPSWVLNVPQNGGCMWTAAVRQTSVGLLKGKALLIKGPLSSGEAPINASWKQLHPGGPALRFHWDWRGGCFPKSTDWDPIFLWSLVCWLQAPIYNLPTPQSIHRLSGGKRITWSDTSSKPSIVTIVTLLGNSISEMCPAILITRKKFFSLTLYDMMDIH